MTNQTNARVKFYCTSQQSEKWKDEADDLGVSYSEYFRMMIVAGRRELGLQEATEEADEQDDLLEKRVVDALDEDSCKTFDQIARAVVEDHYEDRIAEVLQEDNQATYDPRKGGYFLERQP